MNRPSALRRTLLATLALSILPGATALAEDKYPSRPITLIVPFVSGGSTDLIARLIAQHAGAQLGQTIVVENKGGAGGSLGMAYVKRAKPDGYTIGMASVSTHGSNPAVYKALPYDPIKDFIPVTNVAAVPSVFSVNPNVPAKTMKEFIELARANPGKYTFASPGVGSLGHVKTVYVTGYYTNGDGGGGLYYCDISDTISADNGGSIIVADDGGRWKLVFNGEYRVEQFGAKGGTDSTAAFQNAAATGKPLRAGYGNFTISGQVTLAQILQGSGADDGQTTFTLTGAGQFILGDWHARMDGFLIQSAVNSLSFIKNPGMSYFTCTNFRAEKIGAATGQCAIEFDTSTASIYFNNIDHYKIKLDYPFKVTGNNTQVFNANNLGTNQSTGYVQNFLSALTIDGTTAFDTNTFGAYCEVGTNIVTHNAGAMRQNRFRLVSDAVTRIINSTVAITDPNLWEIPDGQAFTFLNIYPQNQIFVGPLTTKVRATDSSGQSIPNASATKVTFNSEQFDALSEFANGTGTFTAKNAGYYLVNASVRSALAAWPAGTRIELQVYKNGALYANGLYNPTDVGVSVQRSAEVSALVQMNGTTDTIDVRVSHNQGAALALDTSPTANYIEITKIP